MMLSITEAMYMNANSIDDPIELFEQLEENNEGEALIESKNMFSNFFYESVKYWKPNLISNVSSFFLNI